MADVTVLELEELLRSAFWAVEDSLPNQNLHEEHARYDAPSAGQTVAQLTLGQLREFIEGVVREELNSYAEHVREESLDLAPAFGRELSERLEHPLATLSVAELEAELRDSA